MNANNAIQSKKASCYSPHQRSTRHDAHTGIHTLALGDQMTPITSTQCHGNSTPRKHPDGSTASHGTRSRRCPHHTHNTHSTHLRSALASTLEPSLVPLETCHPAQVTRIVNGPTNTSPVTQCIQQEQGTHLVLCIHIRTRRDQLYCRLRLPTEYGSMKSSASMLPIAFNKHVSNSFTQLQ